VLGLQRLLGGERRPPVPLQRARDQPHAGVHRLVVAPARERRLVARPLQALRPVPVPLGALQFDILGQPQADLDG